MSTPHLIERLDFEIEFDPPDAELQDERNLARLLQDTLLPVVDEVLAAWDEPGTVLTLPSLTIDLGAIERDALREQAPARLRALLEEALAAARYRSTRAPGDASLLEDCTAPWRRSAQDDALVQLSAYLASGRMAWHHDLTRSDAHVALLERLLGGDRQALVRMLAQSIAQPRALRRLSEQFPARQLAAIVRAAAPRHANGLLAVQAQWHDGRRAGTSRWQLVLGLALGGHDTAVALSALGRMMAQPARPVGAGLPSIELDGLAVWWRRGKRDLGQAAVLERLLNRTGIGGAQDLRRALAAALAAPGGARRLVAAVPASLREKLLRVTAPACAARMLSLIGEVERVLIARIADRAVAAQVHAQCWEEVLTASLHRVALAPSTSGLRARLLALVADAAQLGQRHLAIQVSARGPEQPSQPVPFMDAGRLPVQAFPSQQRASAEAPGELALLRTFLATGRIVGVPGKRVQIDHIDLMDRLWHRLGWVPGLLPALLRLLAQSLARPEALRHLMEQFSERLRAAILLVPGAAATVLAEFAKRCESVREPSAPDARLAAWREALATGLARHAVAQAGSEKPNFRGGPPIRSASSLGQVSATSTGTYATGLARATLVDDARATLLRPLAERFWQRGLAAAVADTLHQRPVAPALGQSQDPGSFAHAEFARSSGYLDIGSFTTWPGALKQIGLQPLLRLTEQFPQPDPAPVANETSKTRLTPSPNELARLREYLVTGRLSFQPEANAGGDHIDLLDSLLERADRIPSLLQALLRMLATALTRPQALRRLTEQFPQRQLVCLLYAAAPAHTASFLALFAEIQGEQVLSNPASTSDALAAWRNALEQALSGRVVGTAGTRIEDAPANLRWDTSPSLATQGAAEEGNTGRAAFARAFKRALAVPDGALRLAGSMHERRRELLVWSAAPAMAVEVLALLHEVGAHKSGVELACWAEVFEACLAPDPVPVGLLCARLRELTAAVRTAHLPADAHKNAERIEQLAAFLRNERDPAAQIEVQRDDHVTLLDALLDGAELPRDLWCMLASILEHAPAALRLVEQFPERQLRDIVARAAPAHYAQLFALVTALYRDGAISGIAPRALRQAIWPALLRAALCYAAGLAPLPGQHELRERVFALLPASAPEVPDSSTREGWLDQIGQQPGTDASLVPAGRHAMTETVAGDGSAWRIAYARAFKRALAIPDGALRLAGSMQEREREQLVWSAAPAMAVEVLALLHEVGAHKSEVELACWGEVLEACLAPGPVSVGLLRARLRELTTAAQPARLTADTGRRAGRIALLAAFLRNERHPAAQTDVQRDDPVTLLDALLDGAEPPRHLWRMLASIVEHAPAAQRLVEQFPERQLRDIVAQAAPAHCPELFALVAVLHRDGAATGIALRPLRLAIWWALLRAVVRYAADLAPLPAQDELRARVFALLPASAPASDHPVMRAVTASRTPSLPWRRAEPELQAARAIRRLLVKVGGEQAAPTPISSLTRLVMAECAALELAVEARSRGVPDSRSGEEWLARIRQQLDTDARIVPARRQAMIEAIAGAASASGRKQEYMRRVLRTLARGESLDLDAIAGAMLAQDAAVDRAGDWPALLASRRADVIRLLRGSARHRAIREALADCLPPPMLQSLAEAARPEIAAPMPATRRKGLADAAAHPGAQPGERIALNNAGMVLMAPYVARLFAMLGLVQEGEFVDLAAAERAVHLLQFAVSGQTHAPEYRLTLNKLLCGLPLDAPVPAGIGITPEERSTIEGLLEAMIASWSALGRTSIDGLRQSFLMREGELELGGELWQLAVAQGPFDMLMDRLPWSFSIVKFAWMPLPLHVTWH